MARRSPTSGSSDEDRGRTLPGKPQSQDWAGHAVASVLHLDLATRAKAASLLKKWIERHAPVVEAQDEKRMTRIEVGASPATDLPLETLKSATPHPAPRGGGVAKHLPYLAPPCPSDIYGDGVNVAARLEGLAEPGGICISGTAFDHAVNKVDVGFASLGEQRLKNIADPVRVYRVLLDPADAGKKAGRPYWPSMRVKILAGTGALLVGFIAFAFEWQKPIAPQRHSVAVLPFAER
jgi:hypothetical protein